MIKQIQFAFVFKYEAFVATKGNVYAGSLPQKHLDQSMESSILSVLPVLSALFLSRTPK